MRKALRTLISILAAMLAGGFRMPAAAQGNIPPPIVWAEQFNNWSLASQGANQFTFATCYSTPLVNAVGNYFVFGLGGTYGYYPVLIADSNPANSEVVTPGATSTTPGSCGFSAATSHSHTSFTVSSGTAGLQDAVGTMAANVGSGTVGIDRRYYNLVAAMPGSKTVAGIIAALKGSATVQLVDVTTSPWTWYAWNGSQYAAAAIGSGTVQSGTANSLTCYPGNGTAVGACTSITTDGSGNLTTVGDTSGNINGCIWVDGTHYAKTNAGVQSAINAAEALGGCVYLPPGVYAMTATTGQQVLITSPVALFGSGWNSDLQLQSGAGAIPLIRIAPSGAGGYVASGITLSDFQVSTSVAGLGTYGVEVDASTDGTISKLLINHIRAGCSNNTQFVCAAGSSFGTGSLALLNPSGTGGILWSEIRSSELYGSITMTRMGDGLDFHNNKVVPNANGDVFSVDFYPGATSFRLENNTLEIPFHFGHDTLHAIVDGNEFEPQSSSLSGSNGAMLDLDGTSISTVDGVAIFNNSFQIVNSSTLNAIRLNYATQVDIGGKSSPNNFQIGTSPAVGIITVSGSAFANRINHNIYSSATWSSILSDGAGNTLITEDANVAGGDAATPLLSQGSGGGTNLYGANGLAIELAGGVNYLTDGSAGANVVAAFSPANSTTPSTSTVASVGNLFSKGTVRSGGTPPTITGCGTISSQVGGGLAGTFVTSATSCTPVLTALPSTTNGYSCMIWDQTHPTTPEGNISSTATSATFGTFTTTASDVIAFNCGISY